MSTPQPPGAVLQHTGRPREEDIRTRRRMTWWDHVKWLVLLAIVWFLLVFSLMGNNPLIGFVDASRIEARLAYWVFILAGLEFLHQLHFLLKEYNGVPVDEPFLRDTVNVAYWDGASAAYPSVKLRMDFRDPNTVGTFVYHCHLLEHEDGGMMGTIRVEPRMQMKSQPSSAARPAPSAKVLRAKDR